MKIGKIGSRKVGFFVGLAILLIIAGTFLFYVWKETKVNEGETVWEKENIGGYQIEGNIIKNLEYGLELQAPEGWNIKNYGMAGVGIFSPEVDANNFVKSAREKEGCILGVKIENYKKINNIKTETEKLRDSIEIVRKNENILDEDNVKYILTSLNNRDALKRIYFIDNKEASMEVNVPISEYIYSFVNGPIFSQKCGEYFDDMIETVKIDR